MQMSAQEFEAVVADALDAMPEQFAELMDNVVVQVRQTPDRETLADLGIPSREADSLLGLYTGVSLDERGGWYGGVLPDVIHLYRRPLLLASTSRADLVRQIQLTLLHEIGHHFGLSDDEMDAWDQEFAGLDT